MRDEWFHQLNQIENVSRETFSLTDIGTGAGFPGMVLAIAGVGQVHLVDSDTKKMTFLREVSRLTQTPVTFHHGRIEAISLPNTDCFTSRATSRLNDLIEWASKNVSRETFFLFHKGKNYSTELDELRQCWSFDHHLHPSVTDPSGVIIHLSHVARLPHENSQPTGKNR